MALETPLLHLGWLTLSTLDDARSTTGNINSGALTALNGPNGSGQFYWVYNSTVVGENLKCRLGSSLITPSTLCAVLGILQNKPGPGEAADIGIYGVTKAIAGSTFAQGTLLQVSSAPVGQSGQVVPFVFGNGASIGVALEAPTSTGSIFSMLLGSNGMHASSLA